MIGPDAANDAVGGQQRPRKGPSEIETRIFELLKSLPDLQAGISEEHCRAYANYLNGVVVMAHMNHQRPEAQQVGAKRTQAQLERLSDLAEKITQGMNSANQEANALITAALPKGVTLSQYKRTMNGVFRVLHQADVDAAELTAMAKKPSDEFAADITRGGAKTFTALTGRKATLIVNGTTAKSGGPFLDFLRRLFAVLGIDASAEYHARKLRRNPT